MFSLTSKLSIMYFLLFMGSIADVQMDRFKSLESIDCLNVSNDTVPVDIQPRNQMLRLRDLLNGSVEIEFEHIPSNHVLLTFASGQSNKDILIENIDCWTTTDNYMVVSNLLANETQTFCLMEKDAKTVSPLDCISILPRNSLEDSELDSVWLTEDDKALAIGLLVMGLIICIACGFGVGILIVKRQLNTKNRRKLSTSSRPDLVSPDWKHDNRDFSFPYNDDTMSIVSGKSTYVAAVNPSRFDLIKMRLEKSENPTQHESENQYDLEDMPYSKAPGAPEGFRDSGISTCGPIYAISSKAVGQNDNNGENLYLCVDHDVVSNDKKNE